jgi:EAL domain-containing protein (putative c-di-GMP-specific phosphodiesterase class I)
MTQEYIKIFSKLSSDIEEAKKDSRKFYFVFINFDINNLLYLGILIKKPQELIKDHICSILEQYQDYLEVEEIFSFAHNFAFIVKKEISAYELHEKITQIYKELNSNLEGFLIAKFSSIMIPDESSDPESIIIQSVGANSTQRSNYLYHQTYDKSRNYVTQSQKSLTNICVLSQAINNKSLYFAFQPIFSCETGQIEFYECLLRLKFDEQVLSTSDLIAAAEEYKYIAMIDEFVLDMAIEKLKSNEKLSLSVNFSRSFIDNKYLIDKIIANFSGENRELASRCIVELTETLLHAEFLRTKTFIKAMQNLGIRVALDDFGKGYTSFHQVKSFNFDIIKIDGAFIKDAIENIDNRVFIEAIVKIAQEIGALTIAEFVENGYTAKYLMDIGIDYMQGHYLSLPLEEV